MSNTELKPCPFCGGKAKTAYAINDYNRWGVYCKHCGCSVEIEDWKGVEDTEENAVEAWNRRAKMSKAVLVMDMPERCHDCPFLDGDDACLAMDTSSVGVDVLKEKPDWCPLVPMPEKIPEPKDGYEAIEVSIKRDGWNSCIDAITGK